MNSGVSTNFDKRDEVKRKDEINKIFHLVEGSLNVARGERITEYAIPDAPIISPFPRRSVPAASPAKIGGDTNIDQCF